MYLLESNERRLTELEEEVYIPDLTVTPLELELNHFVDCVMSRHSLRQILIMR
jgi:hypothetical protein